MMRYSVVTNPGPLQTDTFIFSIFYKHNQVHLSSNTQQGHLHGQNRGISITRLLQNSKEQISVCYYEI